MQSPPLLSVVIPVFNEEDNIKLLIASIENALSEYSYELIFIDDYSSDSSCEIIRTEANPHTNLIVFEHHKGQSSALSSKMKVGMWSLVFAKTDKILSLKQCPLKLQISLLE